MIRHVLYLSDDEVSLFEWENNNLIAHIEFNGDSENLDDFREVVKSLSDYPVQILINIQEEDYQRECIPYSGKKEQAFMAKRLLEKHYRDVQYKHFEIQGRNKEGRRDSRIFLSSVSIDDDLKKYISVFLDMGFSVSGIWSAPILSRNIFYEKESKNYILIVEEKLFYRQSVFVENEMVVSRKIPNKKNLNGYQDAESIVSSVDHLYKFSTNKRLIGFQDDIKVKCLIDADVFESIESVNSNKKISYQCVERNTIFEKINADVDNEIFSGVIYSYLCSNQKVNHPHYSDSNEIIDFVKKKNNALVFRILGILSFVFVFASAAIAINNHSLVKVSEKIIKENDYYQFKYDEKFQHIQQKIDNIELVESLINKSSNLYLSASSIPTELFFELSSVLDEKKFSRIYLEKIKWKRYVGIEYDAVSTFFPKKDEYNDSGGDDLGLDVNEEEEKSKIYAHITGVFDHQYLDYSGAVDTMVYFNNALKTISNVEDVYMISAPIDVRSQSQFIDFSGSLLGLNVSKSNSFEFILSIKDKKRLPGND